jgi:uncharacterized protein YkwD
MSRKAAAALVGMLLSCALAAQPTVDGCAGLPAQAELLQQLNALRSIARICGEQPWPAAPALRWDERLQRSASLYAQELARRQAISHVGERSHALRERLAEVGYPMRVGGENLAAGSADMDQTLRQWLASPAHCNNLMAADFDDAGLACVATADGYRRYWVLHLGRRSAAGFRSSPGRSP